MADPFVAEIRVVGFNFAPTGWAQCNGQLLPISQNTALFSLLGTVYGGDGKSTFALPDIEGNCVIHPGQGQGLSLYDQGQIGGGSFVTLLNSEMPVHTHQGQASIDDGQFQAPAPDRALANSTPGFAYVPANPAPISMNFQAITISGGSLPHNNTMPTLVLNYVIAMQGVFPSARVTDGGPAVALRPARDDDREFLARVYASTREEELAPVPWTAQQKQAFLAQQFAAQSAHYEQHYDALTSEVILVDGERAGRLLLARWPAEIRIVDIALLPAFRGLGVGTRLLSPILDEGDARGVPVTIHVEQNNPAMSLYRRLGFGPVGEHGIYLKMERPVGAQANTAS